MKKNGDLFFIVPEVQLHLQGATGFRVHLAFLLSFWRHKVKYGVLVLVSLATYQETQNQGTVPSVYAGMILF